MTEQKSKARCRFAREEIDLRIGSSESRAVAQSEEVHNDDVHGHVFT
jgi:hypothetical protein